jgi:hypothetical protein
MSQENTPSKATVRWIVENEILLLDAQEASAPGDRSYDDMIIEHLDQATQPIKVIARIGNATSPNMPTPKRATDFKYLQHPRLEQVLLVGLRTNPMARFVSEVVKKVVGVKLKNFDTLEEALTYLEQMKTQ